MQDHFKPLDSSNFDTVCLRQTCQFLQNLFKITFVVFTDNEVSMFSNTPGDITVNNDAGQSFAVVTWTAPTVTDNSGSYTVTSSHSSGSSFTIGITRVTYSVVDASGNTASYSFNITVIGKFIYWID